MTRGNKGEAKSGSIEPLLQPLAMP